MSNTSMHSFPVMKAIKPSTLRSEIENTIPYKIALGLEFPKGVGVKGKQLVMELLNAIQLVWEDPKI